jgi:hypothetical protein
VRDIFFLLLGLSRHKLMVLATNSAQFQTSKAMAVFQPIAQVVASVIIYNSAPEIPNFLLTRGYVTVAPNNK